MRQYTAGVGATEQEMTPIELVSTALDSNYYYSPQVSFPQNLSQRLGDSGAWHWEKKGVDEYDERVKSSCQYQFKPFPSPFSYPHKSSLGLNK